MATSVITKNLELAEVTVNINSTGNTQVPKPVGWELSNVVLLSACCYTKYSSKVDYTYNDFAYFGNLNTADNPMVFKPKVEGNSVKITFLLAKVS